MKLLSVNIARSIWLGNTIDFNPKGKNLYPIIIPLLIESYNFRGFPSLKDRLDATQGIKFEDGEFKTKKDEIISVNLMIYQDGLVVDTRSSTKNSDAFLEEILTKLSEDFNLPYYGQIIKRKNYVSQLYITTDKSLELINPKLKEISKYLSNKVSRFNKVSFEVGGISFWPDQIKVINPIPFTLERTLNVPFSEKRYYSAAPLQTDEHLELLNKIENILGR